MGPQHTIIVNKGEWSYDTAAESTKDLCLSEGATRDQGHRPGLAPVEEELLETLLGAVDHDVGDFAAPHRCGRH